jgi:hypothetical protein
MERFKLSFLDFIITSLTVVSNTASFKTLSKYHSLDKIHHFFNKSI